MFFNHDSMCATVIEWFYKEPDNTREEFVKTHPKDLHKYHHSLGQRIRNEFKLWSKEWEPVLVNGVDMSEGHPDAISMRIIQDVHKRLTKPH